GDGDSAGVQKQPGYGNHQCCHQLHRHFWKRFPDLSPERYAVLGAGRHPGSEHHRHTDRETVDGLRCRYGELMEREATTASLVARRLTMSSSHAHGARLNGWIRRIYTRRSAALAAA